MQILERREAPCACLTHTGHDLAAERLDAAMRLPAGVHVAHDGLAL